MLNPYDWDDVFDDPHKVVLAVDSVQLVNITPISLWFMILITIVNGVYKPTNITGGAHIVTMEHHHFYYGKYKITIWALW